MRSQFYVLLSLFFCVAAAFILPGDPVKHDVGKNIYLGQNICLNVALIEKGDSILLALKNKSNDTMSYYLGFFGKDSANAINMRFDCNLLTDKKVQVGKVETKTLTLLPKADIIYKIKMYPDMYQYLHGFYRYKFFIGTYTRTERGYLNLRPE